MFYVLEVKTISGSKIEKTFNDYNNLKVYENKIRNSLDCGESVITAFKNQSEYVKLINDAINEMHNLN